MGVYKVDPLHILIVESNEFRMSSLDRMVHNCLDKASISEYKISKCINLKDAVHIVSDIEDPIHIVAMPKHFKFDKEDENYEKSWHSIDLLNFILTNKLKILTVITDYIGTALNGKTKVYPTVGTINLMESAIHQYIIKEGKIYGD